jgi:hypothetical protein
MAARGFVVIALLSLLLGATQAPDDTFFSSHDVLTLRLEGPFNGLFTRVALNQKTIDPNSAVTGRLIVTERGHDTEIDGVQIAVRGHTNRREGECSFPKLKVTVPANHPTALIVLGGQKTLKIGTHCGEAPGDTISRKYGRLLNENSPAREAFVYRLLEALGVPTLKARPARITYVYTDPRPSGTPDQRQPLVRNAFIVEDDEDAVARMGGVRQLSERSFTNARDQFSVSDTALIAFAQALIGNFDWCLKMTRDDAYRCNARHPLWNVLAVVNADGRTLPMIYDFDVAGIVTGQHRWFKEVYNDAFLASKSHPGLEVVGQLQRTRTLFERQALEEARAHFMQKKNDAYRALDSAKLDSAGRRVAREYFDAFYAEIGSDDVFYRPAVVVSGLRAYADASRTNTLCSAAGPISVGTVVSEPLQTTDSMMRVVVLDTQWQWATPKPCAAIHDGPVWIQRSGVSRDYPPVAMTHR